jgi:hypothetical protein
MLSNEEILKRKIQENSLADSFADARLEWEILSIYIVPSGDKCICGHQPIKRVCEIANKETGSVVKIGSCCLGRFFDLKTQRIETGLNRLKAGIQHNLSPYLLEIAVKFKIINSIEERFYQKIKGKSRLNEILLKQKIAINKKVLEHFITS